VARLAVTLLAEGAQASRWLCERGREVDGQLQAALASVVANVGEGLAETSAGDRVRFFRYALRSLGEADRLIEAARRAELLPDRMAATLHALSRDVRMDLLRLTRWSTSKQR
jgi:four helix bundle protein